MIGGGNIDSKADAMQNWFTRTVGGSERAIKGWLAGLNLMSGEVESGIGHPTASTELLSGHKQKHVVFLPL